MAASVVVEAGSRLHAGFYHAGPGRPYKWGSAGFYIAQPPLRLEARRCPEAPEPLVEAPREHRETVLRALQAVGATGVCIHLESAPPRHVGLGSTTQVALAAACAARALEGAACGPGEATRLARLLGRARISGAGTLAFAYGGFVVDAGSPDPDGPRLLMRHPIPSGWRFIVALPSLERGIGEEAEASLLGRPWEPPANAERLMARGLLRLAAGVARADLVEALEGLREIQLGTGMYFSRLQGGAYRRDLQAIAGEAQRNGMVLAQSSWGPVLYTITTSEDAWGDAALLKSILNEAGVGGEVIIAKPRNEGAVVRVG